MNDIRSICSKYSKFIIIFSATLLTACQSAGTQYKFPTATEKTADLQAVEGLYINNFNEDGCYSGRTAIKGPVKLRANEPITITYEPYFISDASFILPEQAYCRIFFKFTPAENAQYRVKTEVNVRASADSPGIKAGAPICRIMLQQVMNDGSVQPSPTVALSLRMKRLNCFKIQSQEERQAEAKAEEEADAREEAQEAAEEKAKEEAKAKAKAAVKTPAVSP